MASKKHDTTEAVEYLPTADVPFTYQSLKDAIPEHCFQRNTLRSLSYVASDLAMAAFFYYASTFISHPALPWFAPYVLWPLYWVCQGCVCTGLWVIAHECGHRAFSDNIVLGDAVGMVLHSALLVPYHSWRISHALHHQNTNNMDKDEVFIPVTRSELGAFTPFDEVPHPLSVAKRLLGITLMLVFGWPAYLLKHTTGRKYGRFTSHFDPWAPLFRSEQRHLIIISDVVLLLVLAGLTSLAYARGFLWLFNVYVVPYLIVNMWLVLITDLQHTDKSVPHYRGKEWTWLKGALCTLDRDYGILNSVFHHIGDTHVVHHLFHRMPHYHALEATAAIREKLGPYYGKHGKSAGLRGIAEALWETTTRCVCVEDEGSVLFFKDR